MPTIYDIVSLPGLPPAISHRELIIQQAIDSYRPLYDQLCALAKVEDLTEFVCTATEKQMLDVVSAFLEDKTSYASMEPLDGGLQPLAALDARRYFLMWAANQTESGGFEPFRKAMNRAYPELKRMRKNDRLAIFVTKCWCASRTLNFGWGTISRNAHRGLEGSNRAHAGKVFEATVREAAQQAAETIDPDYRVSVREIKVKGKSGESRIDIVVQKPGRTILIPCKSSQVDGQQHNRLFERDVRDSINILDIHSSDVVIAFGGRGWDNVVAETPYRNIWIKDHFPVDDFLIEHIRDELLDTGIFEKSH